MASKQQIAKENQAYVDKPIFPMCSNCKHFKSFMTYPDLNYPDYAKETISCGLGEFAVKKQNTCKVHRFKEPF